MTYNRGTSLSSSRRVYSPDFLENAASGTLSKWLRLRPVPEQDVIAGGNEQHLARRVECQRRHDGVLWRLPHLTSPSLLIETAVVSCCLVVTDAGILLFSSHTRRALCTTKLLPVTHVLVDTLMLTVKPVYKVYNVSDDLKWTINTHDTFTLTSKA